MREVDPTYRESQTAHRRQAVIIVAPMKGIPSFHFTSTLLQGNDIWFPIGEDSLFVAVEKVMQANEVAHNVTSVGEIRECGPSKDYLVVFNMGEKCKWIE
jgi:hypothetical protein